MPVDLHHPDHHGDPEQPDHVHRPDHRDPGALVEAGLPACGVLHDGHGRPLGVVAGIDVDVDVDGLAVRARWRVRFAHDGPGAVDATYLAPLPAGWAVVGAVAHFGGRSVRAELAERGAARAVYDAALAQGVRAGLLEADRRELFTLSLGRLVPGEQPALELTLVGPLEVDEGVGSVRLPLIVASRYSRPGATWWGPVAGTPTDPDASRARAPRDPSVQLPVTVRLAWRGATAPPEANVIGVDRDPIGVDRDPIGADRDPIGAGHDGWVLRWSGVADRDVTVRAPVLGAGDRAVALPRPGGGHLVRVDLLGDDDGPAGAGAVTPAARRALDVAVVLDRSGSMAGWKMAAARRLAARIVDALTAVDRAVVVGFDDQLEASDPALVRADAPARRRIGRFLDGLDARGGTELDRAVVHAGTLLHAPWRPTDAGDSGRDGHAGRDRVLVLVTDAQVTAESATRNAVASVLGDAQLYVVGIDEAVNAGLCRDLAALGGGRFDLVTGPDEVGAAVDRVVRRVGRPAARHLRVVGVGAAALLPRDGADHHIGSPTTVWAAVDADLAGRTVTVEADTPAGPLRRTLPVVAAGDPVLHQQCWAAAELAQLEFEADFGSPSAMAAALALSLASGVLCRFSAFVAVDHAGDRVPGAPDPVVQPLGLPSGWAAGAAPLFAAAAPAPALRLAAPASAASHPVAPQPPAPRRARRAAPAPVERFELAGDGFDDELVLEDRDTGPADGSLHDVLDERRTAAGAAAPAVDAISAALRRRVLSLLEDVQARPIEARWALRELLEDLDTFTVPGSLRDALAKLADELDAVAQHPGRDRTALAGAVRAVREAVTG